MLHSHLTTLNAVSLVLNTFKAEGLPFEACRTGITSGYYGEPPRWGWWAKQAVIYFSGLMGMKMVVWGIFELFPWLGMVGDFLLKWTEGDRMLQVGFVMFVSFELP